MNIYGRTQCCSNMMNLHSIRRQSTVSVSEQNIVPKTMKVKINLYSVNVFVKYVTDVSDLDFGERFGSRINIRAGVEGDAKSAPGVVEIAVAIDTVTSVAYNRVEGAGATPKTGLELNTICYCGIF